MARRVTLVVAFGFFPKILGGGRDLQMVLCHSMNPTYAPLHRGGGSENNVLVHSNPCTPGGWWGR